MKYKSRNKKINAILLAFIVIHLSACSYSDETVIESDWQNSYAEEILGMQTEMSVGIDQAEINAQSAPQEQVQETDASDTGDEILNWYEMDDYDGDHEWDTLDIKRYIREDRIESYYKLELSGGGVLEAGPFLNTAITIWCADLNSDELKEVIIETQHATNTSYEMTEIIAYEQKDDGYQVFELPRPEVYVNEYGMDQYVVGYDLYVLAVNENFVTIGNSDYSINAQFEIPQKMVDSPEWGEISLSQLYDNLAKKHAPIGGRTYQIWTVKTECGIGLELQIAISPEEDETIRSAVIKIENQNGEWKVLDTEIIGEEYYIPVDWVY